MLSEQPEGEFRFIAYLLGRPCRLEGQLDLYVVYAFGAFDGFFDLQWEIVCNGTIRCSERHDYENVIVVVYVYVVYKSEFVNIDRYFGVVYRFEDLYYAVLQYVFFVHCFMLAFVGG